MIQVLWPEIYKVVTMGSLPNAYVTKLPLWAPDPCEIVSARLFNQGSVHGNVGFWQVVIDKGGAYTDSTAYPFTQTCAPGQLRCYKNNNILADYDLEGSFLGANYLYNPPVRYSRSEGDLLLIDFPGVGGITAQPIWQIGWIAGDVPPLPTAPAAFSTAFSASPSGANAANGVSIRNIVTLSAGGNRIRVTFKAGASGRYMVNNASVGIGNGTFTDTIDFPVELSFNGESGFDIAAGTAITSDWAVLASAASQNAVIITDNADVSCDSISSAGNLCYSTVWSTYALKKCGTLSGWAAGTHSVASIETGA